MEKSVKDELHGKGEGDRNQNKIQQYIKQEVVISGFIHVLFIRVHIILGDIFYLILQLI